MPLITTPRLTLVKPAASSTVGGFNEALQCFDVQREGKRYQVCTDGLVLQLYARPIQGARVVGKLESIPVDVEKLFDQCRALTLPPSS